MRHATFLSLEIDNA